MIDVLFCDDRGGFGPTFNRTHAVGGAEMHLVQVAEFLASRTLNVLAVVHGGQNQSEGGVQYVESRTWSANYLHCRTLIVVGCASVPEWADAHATLAFQVVDPRPHPQMFDHLKGRATMVCVSEWQAGLFRALGHRATVIPVPVPDHLYGSARMSPPLDHVCISSWNKGAQQTLDAWDPLTMGELAIGSAYSHPDDAESRCAAKGARWLGVLKQEQWYDALRSAEAVARVCTIAETFGVTDVFARAVGIPSYTLCTGEVGSLAEVGARPFTDPAEWREAIKQRRAHPGGDAERFRASRVLPRWLELVGG